MRELYNRTAEEMVLGAMMLSPQVHEDLSERLSSDDFAFHAHRLIFDAIKAIRIETKAWEVDVAAIETALGERGVKEIGGPDILLGIAMNTVSAANCEVYVSEILGMAYLRRVWDWAKALGSAVKDGDASADDVRAFLSAPPESGFLGVAPVMHLADVDSEGGDTGFPTGFPQLDGAISTGGYPDGQMTVVRAYHKGGKSTFMVSSYVHAAMLGKRCLYATFADLSAKQLKRRVMRNLTTWSKRPHTDLLSQIEYDKCLERIGLEWDAYLFDASQMDSGSDVETFASWLKAQHRIKPFDVVFVDYAQKLSSSSKRAHNSLEEAKIVSNTLSRLASRLGIPVVVGSQITDGGEGKKAITKGSRAWEEDAGWVLTLERENPDDRGNANVKCEISFSRFGPQEKEMPLKWNAERLRIEQEATL